MCSAQIICSPGKIWLAHEIGAFWYFGLSKQPRAITKCWIHTKSILLDLSDHLDVQRVYYLPVGQILTCPWVWNCPHLQNWSWNVQLYKSSAKLFRSSNIFHLAGGGHSIGSLVLWWKLHNYINYMHIDFSENRPRYRYYILAFARRGSLYVRLCAGYFAA